jgi:hypothetical protein
MRLLYLYLEVDVNYVPIKFRCGLHNAAGKMSLCRRYTHIKIAALGSSQNVKKRKSALRQNSFQNNHKHTTEVSIALTALLSIPTFSCLCSDAVWFCMSGGWGSAI